MESFCECGIPWAKEGNCERCGRKISEQRLASLTGNQGSDSQALSVENEKPIISSDLGLDAATRVRRYGTLFEKIGLILQTLNTIAALILVIFLFTLKLEGRFVLLGLLVIAILWGLSYLQTALIRGLASYFQMRSADYFEKRANK